jgi:UTP--glucose-1-phosphate uridylyltransferase
MKGVIVAAGYGARFLPVTKTVPKEMLPLVNKPSIDFIVEELVSSGITEILFITSRRKKALEDYFDREIELETFFTRKEDAGRLSQIAPREARFFFVRQREMLGTGHALLQARAFVGKEPFIVAYPDDLHFGKKPLSRQLMDMYEKTGCTVLATIHDPPDLGRYGVISIAADNLHVTGIVEKPAKGREPSREATVGRYLYAPDFLERLEREWRAHGRSGEEFWHASTVQALAAEGRVVYTQVEGLRLDTGEPAGYIDAIIRYAESVPAFRPALDKAVDDALRRRRSGS